MRKEEFFEILFSLKEYFAVSNLSNQQFIIFIFGIFLTFLIGVFLMIKLFKTKSSTKEFNKSKPTVEKIINSNSIPDNSDKNDFIDILVAIEEEMAVVRELYVSGYITKGIYISETDRLYSKAKIFGL